MADTSFLRREVEGYVRAQLEEEFGQPFAARVLPLWPGVRHEFDAVSVDGTVVASVKSASGLTAGGRITNGKIKDCLAELYYLSLVEEPWRRLVLTMPAFFTIFTCMTTGAVVDGIEVVCMPLPPAIVEKVDLVVREVTPTIAAAAVAAEVESEMEAPEPPP